MRTINCDGCGKQVEVDSDGRIEQHSRGPAGNFEECPSSKLVDLTARVKGGNVPTISGGLPTLGKHHR